jgi:hypothetical protein
MRRDFRCWPTRRFLAMRNLVATGGIADVDECTLLLLPRVRPISLGRRLRLRGPRGAQDVFGLAAIAQNLRWAYRWLLDHYRPAIAVAFELRRRREDRRHQGRGIE